MKYDDIHAKLIRQVCQSKQCPRDRFDDLLEFIALTYTRSPNMRKQITYWMEQQTGQLLEESVQNPKSWIWLAEIIDKPLSDIYTLVKEYEAKKQPKLWCVLIIDVLKCLMLPLLKSKTWSLCVSQLEDYFVCSNSPLGITWSVGHPSNKHPTLGDEQAILTFPLDRYTALVTGLDENGFGRNVSRDAVAEVNSQTLLSLKTHAVQHSFVFAPIRDSNKT